MKLIFVTTLKPMNSTLTKFITEQNNAVQSWLRLDIDKKIIICGNDDGYEEFCSKYGLIHEKDCESVNKVPIVGEMMKCAYNHGDKHDIYIWINADIILLSDFTKFINGFMQSYPDYYNQLYGITTARYNWNDFKDIDFNNNWEDILLQEKLILDDPNGLDIFIHSYKAFDNIPNLVQARFCHDSWLINRIYDFPINIDATNVIKIIHQWNDWYINNTIVKRDQDINKYNSLIEIQNNKKIWENVEKKCNTSCQLQTKAIYMDKNITFINFNNIPKDNNILTIYKLTYKNIHTDILTNFKNYFLNVQNCNESDISALILKDKNDIIFTNGDENIKNNKIVSFKYYKHHDIIGNDYHKIYSDNLLYILFSYILDDNIKAFNTKGYIKNKLGEVKHNWFIKDGGVVVKTDEKSNIYIPYNLCQLPITHNIPHFNIIY